MRGLLLLRLALLAAAWALALAPAAAGKVRKATNTQTVCTITVNSADEKEAFARHLPASRFRFVELVEPGRPDWLASACRAGVTCDVLLISGHFDGVNEFFSDKLESHEFLPVDEMERVACGSTCPGLFSRLKEVHLFGCNTLNPTPQSAASQEVVRSLVREGRSPAQARLQWQALVEEHGQSSLDRMRLVFQNVPVIYGFSSVAPLGPIAASTLQTYFRQHGAGEIGQGRASRRLLGLFSPFAMTTAQGMTDQDPHADIRRDVCRFADDGLPDAEKLDFVHQLLQQPSAQARVHLDRIQRLATALQDPARQTPEVAQQFDRIAGDDDARSRFLDFARDADHPAVRTRMLRVARQLGWLSDDALWQELALMLGDLQARSDLGIGEVNFACTLNRGHELDGAFSRRVPPGLAENVAHAAVRACLGSSEGQDRTLAALVGEREADVQIAQAYLRHRPISDPTELRALAARIAAMGPSQAQVHALEALGRHYVSDRSVLELLVRVFSQTPSAAVQAAVAGILIRADRRAIASPELLTTLRKTRLKAAPGPTMVDALIGRLQAP